VSVSFERPFYQFFLPGTQLSQPGQVWEAGTAIAAELLSQDDCVVNCSYYALPTHCRGRNVPDISFNAGPETGYVIYYTSEPSGEFEIIPHVGGTSFVAPQLNGVSALLGQCLHVRMGLINFPLYQLGLTGQGYRGPHAPFHAIRYGDNWFHHGTKGYNPAAGLGTLDVANFAQAFAAPSSFS